MLVLTRKKEEKLYIGNDITLTVLKIKGNSVQIGVEAPRHVRVLRSELTVPLTSEQTCDDASDSSADDAKSPPRVGGTNRLRQLAASAKREPAVLAGAVQLV